jgi:hypothetical protein
MSCRTASSAERGHFVTCISCRSASITPVLPLVGINEQSNAKPSYCSCCRDRDTSHEVTARRAGGPSGRTPYCTGVNPSFVRFPCTAGEVSQSRKACASAFRSDFAITTAHCWIGGYAVVGTNT